MNIVNNFSITAQLQFFSGFCTKTMTSHRDSIKSFSPPSSLFIAHVHTQKGNKIPSAAGPWSQVASTRVQSMHVTRQHSSRIQLCWPMRQLSRWIASESTLSSMDVFLWAQAPIPRLLLDEGKKLCDPKFIFIVQALSLGGSRQDFCNQFILQKLDNKNCHCAHGNNAQWGGGGRLNEWQAPGPLLFSCSWYIFNRNGAMVAPLLTCQPGHTVQSEYTKLFRIINSQFCCYVSPLRCK